MSGPWRPGWEFESDYGYLLDTAALLPVAVVTVGRIVRARRVVVPDWACMVSLVVAMLSREMFRVLAVGWIGCAVLPFVAAGAYWSTESVGNWIAALRHPYRRGTAFANPLGEGAEVDPPAAIDDGVVTHSN